MTNDLVSEYTARVCVPRGHTHPNTLRALIECASNYLAESEAA